MTPISFALAHSLPEVVLAVGALALLMLGVFRARDGRDWIISECAIAVLGLAFLLLFVGTGPKVVVFDGAFVDDAYGRYMKGLALIGSMVTLLLSLDYMRREKIDLFEFPVLVLLATLGMLMLISAQTLMSLYLGLELMSLSLYVIAAFHRDNVRASEAGLKYFALGALSSGMLLYGASLLYGFAGTVSLEGIATAIHGKPNIGVIFGLVFLLAGLSFKMSAVAITVRVVMTAFPGVTDQWRQILIFVAILSMALGAFAAIGQSNIKRLMAYSSIGHMGFALVGLAAGTEQGVQGVLVYLSIYLTMTLGTFAAILSMRVGDVYVEKISDLAGLSRTNAPMAIFLSAMMLSLAGIPPLAGFFAKWYVFNAAIQAHLYPLAVIGVLMSVVACFYYLRIVKVIYFDEPAPGFERASPAVTAVLIVASLLVVFFSFWPGPLDVAAAAAAKSLF